MSRQIFRSLLHQLVRRHANRFPNDPLHAYRSAWSKLTGNGFANFLARRYRHRFQPDAQELLTLILIEHIGRRHPLFDPPLRHECLPQTFAHGSTPPPAIIVGTHTGYGSAYAALSNLGHHVSLLIDARIEERNPEFGRARHPDLELIPNDRLSLARTIRALKDGRLVCCAVDYQDPARRTYCLVSPVIFELARRSATPLYFAKNTVADDGTIELTIDGPFPVQDAARSAQDLIDYINVGRSQPKALQVRTLSDDASLGAASIPSRIKLPAATPPATTAPPPQQQ